LSYLLVNPQLVAEARDGSATALDQLLLNSRTQILRYAERHCIVHDVEDAVQETLIQTSRHIAKLRAVEAFAGWVFRIAKRECDRLKRGWRMHIRDYAPDQPMPELVTRPAAELRHDLMAAVQSLPLHYREVLLLRDAEGLSIEEIADHLDLTRLAVKARLHRARVLVREYLDE
jgi:RNA polymerase sigma factor (sigma-70 family)